MESNITTTDSIVLMITNGDIYPAVNDTLLNASGGTGQDNIQGLRLPDHPTYKLALSLLLWTLPVIIACGTVGNVFSFILMLQREMRQTSTYFYLAILAIVDTIVLFASAFKTWIRLMSGFELLHISDAGCRIFLFLTYFGLHVSAWLIVAVTVERFIVVWFPLKATSFCSTRRAKMTTGAISVFFALLNSHLFWTAELLVDQNTGFKQCAMMRNNRFLYMKIMPWLHFTIYCLVPFIALLVFNGLIILSMTVTHRQLLTNQMTKDDRRMRHIHRKLAITLLCISFVWMLTTTPSALYTVLPLEPKSLNSDAQLFLAKIICYILLYINHSINFILYCITGQSFRSEFHKLICRIFRKKKKPKARLTFRASRSGSGQETTFPLMDNKSKGSHSSSQTHSQLI